MALIIPIQTFAQTAQEKLLDAECLLSGSRFDGAVYLAGYALEIAFKVRLCRNNNLQGFPGTKDRNDSVTKGWFIHSLIQLDNLCNLNLTSSNPVEWSDVKNWDIEARYKRSMETPESAEDFLESVRVLLAIII